MTELPRYKVGVVACSGEELAEGTVTRLAALRVLGYLRSDDTVTICLPLFLAGGEGDRQFARLHPTIAVDGCNKRCAARATEMYSGKPAASVVVSDVVAQHGIGVVAGRRQLNDAGQQAVIATAEYIATLVDELLGKNGDHPIDTPETPTSSAELPLEGETTCACGFGIPVQNVVIDGAAISFIALPLIMQQFRAASKPADAATARDLLDAVRIYIAIPDGADDQYTIALQRAYASFCDELQVNRKGEA
ncbi:MAG TPA: putative zinc-binding protein [Anaerolineae bacterium]|jgi:uncharacterized metal-binding protein